MKVLTKALALTATAVLLLAGCASAPASPGPWGTEKPVVPAAVSIAELAPAAHGALVFERNRLGVIIQGTGVDVVVTSPHFGAGEVRRVSVIVLDRDFVTEVNRASGTVPGDESTFIAHFDEFDAETQVIYGIYVDAKNGFSEHFDISHPLDSTISVSCETPNTVTYTAETVDGVTPAVRELVVLRNGASVLRDWVDLEPVESGSWGTRWVHSVSGPDVIGVQIWEADGSLSEVVRGIPDEQC